MATLDSGRLPHAALPPRTLPFPLDWTKLHRALTRVATSPRQLKDYHNKVKRALIDAYATGAPRLLDLACGRGGDLCAPHFCLTRVHQYTVSTIPEEKTKESVPYFILDPVNTFFSVKGFPVRSPTIIRLTCLVCGANSRRTRLPPAPPLSHRMYLSVSFGKSTPLQNRQLIVYYF
jgi:hypothetical protein